MNHRQVSRLVATWVALLLIAAGPPSAPDRSGRDHPLLQDTNQPLGDLGGWYVLDVTHTKSSEGATLTKLDDGSILVSGHDPDHDTYTVTAKTTLKGITALRLEVLADESLPRNGPGRSSGGNFTLSRLKLEQAPSRNPEAKRGVTLLAPQADYSQRGYDVLGVVDADDSTGWSIGTGGEDHGLLVRPESPLGDGEPVVLTFTLEHSHPERKGYTLGRFRLSATTGDPPPAMTEEPGLQPLQVNVGFVPVPISAFQLVNGGVAEPFVTADGSLVISGGKAINDTYTFELHTELERVTGLRLEAIGDEKAKSGPGRGSPNFAVSELIVEAAPKDDPTSRQPVVLVNPSSDCPATTQPVEYAIDGNERTIWNVKGRGGETRAASFLFATPVSHESGTVYFITLRQRLAIGRLRASLTTADDRRHTELRPPGLPKKAEPVQSPKRRVELYFNLGGFAYADPRGHQWVPARKWREGRDGYIGGITLRTDSNANPLLRSAITGIDAFRVHLPDGRYRVAMVFAEVRPETAAGYRRFNVAVEGTRVLQEFDPIRQAGAVGLHTLHVLPAVKVRDGVLEIEFTGEKPILNALAVTGVDEEKH